MAGALERVQLVQPTELETGSAQLVITPYALVRMQELGVPVPQPPQSGYKGEMPQSLTSLDDEHLGDLLNDVGLWCAFLDGQLAISDVDRKAAEADLEFRKARIRIAIKAYAESKLTNQDKTDMMTTDPRVLEAERRSLYCEAVYSLIKAARNKAQQAWETVSRRITQRGQEIERMKREVNVAGMPATRTFRRG